ncbi:adenylate/guanylate cyclase domain-containing protein [Teredinibacter purpureus]|uniref:adenylate/guanylate cyclase domain-containing protein n=1 Tax=Teredinibacter purpureus TaxID=2731756 RepID=UPI0005F81FAE|nr:adenylate/guanylate cyclase domain-containing protein [Teredinibacter purpureus]
MAGPTYQVSEKLAAEFSLRQNDIRTLICFAAAGTLMVTWSWPNIPQIDGLFTLGILIYTAGTYLLLRKRVYDNNRGKLFHNVMTLDAAVIGFVLGLSNFSILPSILFITMIQFNGLINGGAKKWVVDNIAFIAGVCSTFLVREPNWTLSNNMAVSIVSLIGIFTYFCAYALFVHTRFRKLDLHTKQLVNEQTLYKLRTYKLARYLTPTVWRAINEGREQALASERKRVTVFFSDIRGFSSLTEELEAETLTDLLNTYLTEMVTIATKHRGTIDKFMGDAIMVIFGDTQSEGLKKDCIRCLAMAIAMRKKMKELQTRWYNQGIKKPLQIRMGINTGYCTVGSFGTTQYMDYTVLGTHVNLASRLESAADAGEILISHETWSLVKDVIMCQDKGEISAKGFSHPIKVYQVVDFRKVLGRHQSYFEENAEGFSMHMDLEKIKNYDKNKVVDALEIAAERLRDKIIK